MSKTVDVDSVHVAVQICMNQCMNIEQLETAGNCVVEMLSAIGFDDGEMIEALRNAQGMWLTADEYIDSMIERIGTECEIIND